MQSPARGRQTRRSRSQPAICSCDNRHLLGSDLMLSPAPVGSEAIEGLIEMRWGGDGEATRFICDYLACNRRACRLLGPLPAMLRIPRRHLEKRLARRSASHWRAGIARQAAGLPVVARKAFGTCFHRSVAPLCTVEAARSQRLACGIAGSTCRPRTRSTAWRSEARLDG